jgi:hypothetical protein
MLLYRTGGVRGVGGPMGEQCCNVTLPHWRG